MSKAPVYWVGKPTEDLKCELCSNPFGDKFVDGNTGRGWACVCMGCFSDYGMALGTGRGQQYEKQKDERWMKIAG